MHTPIVETGLAGQRAGGDVAALLATRQARIPLDFMDDGRDPEPAELRMRAYVERSLLASGLVRKLGVTA